jgi:hypothetical protein
MLTLFQPYDGCGQAGFHHLFDRFTSLLDPGRDLGLWPNTPKGSQQWIGITGPRASGSGSLGTWYDGRGHMSPCTIDYMYSSVESIPLPPNIVGRPRIHA